MSKVTSDILTGAFIQNSNHSQVIFVQETEKNLYLKKINLIDIFFGYRIKVQRRRSFCPLLISKF